MNAKPDCPHGEEAWYCDACAYAMATVTTDKIAQMRVAGALLARIALIESGLICRDPGGHTCADARCIAVRDAAALFGVDRSTSALKASDE